MTFDEALDVVCGTTDPAVLFAAHGYRELARVLHPDAVPAHRRDAATEAFARLGRLWETHRDGVTLRTATATYRLGASPRHRGDVADLYDVGGDRLLKLPRHPSDNDLMERETSALRTIASRGDPRFLTYLPRLVDSFRHRDPATGAERRVNVIGTAGGLHPLTEVRRAYPDGLPPRDAAWMWRRLLIALSVAHRAGVVHGAVLPPHILIHPAERGLVLIDWCYSVDFSGRTHHGRSAAVPTGPGALAHTAGVVPAMVPGYADWYPPEVPAKEPPLAGTDLAMAARVMTELMGDRAPKALTHFAAGCRLPHLRQRPDDALRLLAELDGVLDRLFGPRVFTPFRLNP
ncbi:hypothetical protein Val02_23460 [Virgisporangium aliadipatigenens]|uniref:Protein kinase domain-containing protein n=1 Tax=Virgisporangium aliadipatigenens TaxID=741659 RepID=A0A8J4DP10_9ACTN|nr:serine/threonine protein kinase [Virgisporangium aliadipatigenens]GIJ45460.1 hypothetical protein Val02_23460 [Virgisporangium aliadipatigenens]